MPRRIASICRNKACKQPHRNKGGYCDEHKQESSGWARTQAKKGNTTERGYGYAWEQIKKQIIERDKNLCQPCRHAGRLTESYAVDHINHKAHGGNDEPNNLQCICKACHDEKTKRERLQGEGRVKSLW